MNKVKNDLVVRMKNVHKTYLLDSYEVHAIQGIDLEISAGELAVLMGPSGSGKSTLLNMLGCIDLPTSGTVQVCGHLANNLSERELSEVRRDHIGFIFQSFNLIPVLSVAENVEYALILKKIPEKERRGRVEQILNEVGLQDHAKHRPNQLSGGQRQRVAIARALIAQPRLVLADEPTANLDSVTGMAILDLMAKMNKIHRTTFLFATHDPDVLNYARRVIRIHDGKIESDISHSGGKKNGSKN